MTQQGSILPMSAALIAVGVIVLVLALDVTLYAAAVREVAYAADVGAEAGASRVDETARYSGALHIDEATATAAAVEAAARARPRDGRSVEARLEGGAICVVVAQPYRGRLVSVVSTITARVCAAPSEG